MKLEGRTSRTTSNVDDSRSSTPPSDYQAFPQSDSPRQWDEEDDDDGDKQWEVEAVVCEEITIFYKRLYQVDWANWKRRGDGTSTTWEYAMDQNKAVISPFRKSAKTQRKEAAHASSDINMRKISSSLPHDIHTAESAEAFEEKLHFWKGSHNGKPNPIDWYEEVEQLKKRRAAGSSEPAQGKKRTRHGDVIVVPRADQKQQSVKPISHSTTLKKVKAQNSSAVQAHRSPSSSTRRPPISEVERRWNEEATRVGAAEIRIVNEIDDEKLPPISDEFLYLESSRLYDEGVKPPEDYADFLTGCDCEERCNSSGLECECQADSQCNDSADMPTLAYDKNGLFLFTDHGEVVECNKCCSCDESCGNRVAQKPRDFPIEIFKTTGLGWGVRTRTDIPKGKVLGLYTGRVMTRKKAGDLSREAQAYTFALDLRDGDPEFEEQYTISAYEAGNWTRFVNHSCDPSAKIYNVIFDTVRQANMPNIAYVAFRAIPAGSEITIDYDPAATLAAILGKGKGKAKKGRTRCLCGSDKCRGWL